MNSQRPEESLSITGEAAGNIKQIDNLVSARILDLNDRIHKSSSQTSQVRFLKHRVAHGLRYDSTSAVPAGDGDSGNYYLDPQHLILYFSQKFKGMWLSIFEGLKLEHRQRCVAIDIFVLHELFHIDQNLTSPRHGDIRDAPAVLRTLDYHADANSAIAHLELGWLRDELRKLEFLNLHPNRAGLAIMAMEIEGVLHAMEVFNYPMEENGLLPARFLRYFTWHYQYHRVQRFQDPTDLTALNLLVEPAISIKRLTGRSAVRKLVTMSWPLTLPKSIGCFLWITSPNRWTIPALWRYYPTKPEKISQLFRGIFQCNLSASKPFFEEVFDGNRALISDEGAKTTSTTHVASPRSQGKGLTGVPELIPKAQAARELSLTPEELDRLIEKCSLEIEDIGGVTFVSQNSVNRLLPMFQRTGVIAEETRGVLRRDFLIAGSMWSLVDIHVMPSLERAIVASPSVGQREKVEELLGLHSSALEVSYGPLLKDLDSFHPDNCAGGNAIYAALIGREELLFPHLFGTGRGIDIDRDNNILVAGGPVGCTYTRIAFEFEGPDAKHLTRRNNPVVPLRWYGIADSDDPLVRQLGQVAYILEGENKIICPNNWPLIDTQARQPKVVSVGKRVENNSTRRRTFWLADNYLTITRLPNFLSWRANHLLSTRANTSSWPQLVILDGRNGLGTRGAELLTQKAGEEALHNALLAVSKFGSAYQILLKLTSISTDTGFSRFTCIEFIDAHEVRMSHDALKQAYTYAQQRLNT